jgi:nicotinamide mononucleotide transporter
MQYIGYYWWTEKGPRRNDDLPVMSLTGKTNILIISAILAITGINGYLMSTYTDASFPYADALTTWMSVFAQIMMINKIVESWALWVVMDAIAIYIYAAKGLLVVSGLYGLFFILATMGGIAWYKALQTQNAKTI